jgi:succinate dehydrogenase flavin-adding protein (antitoxin of CptAB toxin-antitoxin module)
MKYFLLKGKSAIILKLSDERTAEFTARSGWEDEAREIVEQFELLRDFDVPIYTDERLLHFFPDASEISEDQYDSMLTEIKEYNAESEKMEKHIDSLSEADLQTYITMFPTANPGLVSFAQISRLIQAFTDLREDLETNPDVDPDDIPDSYVDDIKAVYALLKSAETTKDTTAITQILKVVGGL